MSDEPSDLPPDFVPYTVDGVGTVTAHEGDQYITALLDGRVCGFPAPSGTPSESTAAADIAYALAHPPLPPPPVVQLSRLQFKARFTPVEWAAIIAARATDTHVDEFYREYALADYISSDDERTQAALAYLVTIGLLAADRPDQLLAQIAL